jgi:NAD(P)-dependent dehydrogenase (short-subunit alcohol dehydrogenase family)
MIDQCIQEFHHLDVVFANAGTSEDNDVEAMQESQWDKVIDTNLKGIFLTCKAAIPELIKVKNSSIVTMASSMSAWDASSDGAAYMASKAGVIGLTKSLALQLAKFDVRVNAICPGIIETHLGFAKETTKEEFNTFFSRFAERIPLRRVGQPEDVAATVAFLASDDARHITGSALLIDGGQTLQSWSNAPDGEYPWLVGQND